MKLSEISYQRVTLEEYSRIIHAILEEFDQAESAQQQKEVYLRFIQQTKHYQTMRALLSIRRSQNSEDTFYHEEEKYYIQHSGQFRILNESMKSRLLHSPYRKELAELTHPLIFAKLDNASRIYSEEILPLVKEERLLCQEYSRIMSTAKIPFRGCEYTISQMGRFCEDKNRETRREAYAAQGRWIKSTNVEDIFDKLVKIRDKIAKILGFTSYTEVGYLDMNRVGYSKADVAKFRKQVKEDLLPVVMELKKKQAADIGVSEITLIDNTTKFIEGNPQPIGNADYLFEKGREMYEEMSPETHQFFHFMLDNECFDVLSRDNKAPGGYCTSLPEYKLPFIFANFNGTGTDVDVLFHECGHAFFDYMNQDIPYPDLQNTFMETSETHAKSMEFFAQGYSKWFFGDRYQDYEYAHLSKGLDFIPYAVIVDYFQELVYENPDDTKEERNARWNRLIQEYAPYLAADDVDYYKEGIRWQFQLHIFSAPFYYIDYALSQAVALQFYAEISKDRNTAWKKYISYIKTSAFMSFEDGVKAVGLRSPFEAGALKEVANVVLKELFPGN